MENQWLSASDCLLYLHTDRPSTQTSPACQYIRSVCVFLCVFVRAFHLVSMSVGGEEGEKADIQHIERDKRSKVMLVLFSYPASCASCALMTDSKLLVCKNSHTAGQLYKMIKQTTLMRHDKHCLQFFTDETTHLTKQLR